MISNKLDKYESGYFIFDGEKMLSQVSNAPKNKSGIYIICILNDESGEEIVYIGKAGTLKTDGFNNRSLHKRINGKQGDIKRQKFFSDKIKSGDVKRLKIYWFDTWSVGDLPGYVEGIVIQEYFNKNKRLPIWNKAY